MKTGGWETLSSDGRVWPGFVSLNGEVMSHTKLPSSQPAGMQLACTKEICEGRPSPQRRPVSAWQPFKPCFPFHLHICFYVWISVRHVSLCVCGCVRVFLFSREIVSLTSTLLLFTGWLKTYNQMCVRITSRQCCLKCYYTEGALRCDRSSRIWR